MFEFTVTKSSQLLDLQNDHCTNRTEQLKWRRQTPTQKLSNALLQLNSSKTGSDLTHKPQVN